MLSNRRLLGIQVGLLCCILLPNGSLAEEKKVEEKKETFGSVYRFHYRPAITGESTFAQGLFKQLPHDFFIVENLELITAVGDNSRIKFNTFNLEADVGRPFYPSAESGWGKTFGWVVRFQKVTNVTEILSGGIQWNISDTPVAAKTLGALPWKSFIQVFAKTGSPAGTYDIYNWNEIPIVKNRVALRVTNAYYFIARHRDYYVLTQDLIYFMKGGFAVYFRHYYQNIDRFFNRSDGSQFSIGFRYTL